MLLREDVCIVLNEREPLKRQMADELESALRLKGCAVSRERPSSVLIELLKERRPRVAVLDYLLGDEGTALDVLEALQNDTGEKPFEVIIWTDEPSVSVAVGAIKLGAYDYIEAPGTPNINRIVHAVLEALSEEQGPPTPVSPAVPLVAQDNLMLDCLARVKAAAADDSVIVVLYGPQGSGRNSLARAFHEARRRGGCLFEVDWDSYPHPVEFIFGSKTRSVPLLSDASTVFIDHIEFDDHQLLSHAGDVLWGSSSSSSSAKPRLIVGTSLKEAAAAWARLVGARVIAVPALSERKGDLLPLLQRFLGELRNPRPLRQLLTAEVLTEIAGWDWPGNVRQLRAAFFEVAACVETADSQLSTAEFLRRLADAKQSWQDFNSLTPEQPEPTVARRALEDCAGDLRAAAARLGTGIPQLKAALAGALP